MVTSSETVPSASNEENNADCIYKWEVVCIYNFPKVKDQYLPAALFQMLVISWGQHKNLVIDDHFSGYWEIESILWQLL